MTVENIKPSKLYFSSFFAGLVIMIILLILVCTSFNFDYKSAASVYFVSGIGYTLKSAIFFLPYFKFYDQDNIDSRHIRRLIIWSPLILFVLWFFVIIFFEISFLIPDISYGYIMRFPHFYLQLLTVILICIWTVIKFNRNPENNNLDIEIEKESN